MSLTVSSLNTLSKFDVSKLKFPTHTGNGYLYAADTSGSLAYTTIVPTTLEVEDFTVSQTLTYGQGSTGGSTSPTPGVMTFNYVIRSANDKVFTTSYEVSPTGYLTASTSGIDSEYVGFVDSFNEGNFPKESSAISSGAFTSGTYTVNWITDGSTGNTGSITFIYSDTPIVSSTGSFTTSYNVSSSGVLTASTEDVYDPSGVLVGFVNYFNTSNNTGSFGAFTSGVNTVDWNVDGKATAPSSGTGTALITFAYTLGAFTIPYTNQNGNIYITSPGWFADIVNYSNRVPISQTSGTIYNNKYLYNTSSTTFLSSGNTLTYNYVLDNGVMNVSSTYGSITSTYEVSNSGILTVPDDNFWAPAFNSTQDSGTSGTFDIQLFGLVNNYPYTVSWVVSKAENSGTSKLLYVSNTDGAITGTTNWIKDAFSPEMVTGVTGLTALNSLVKTGGQKEELSDIEPTLFGLTSDFYPGDPLLSASGGKFYTFSYNFVPKASNISVSGQDTFIRAVSNSFVAPDSKTYETIALTTQSVPWGNINIDQVTGISGLLDYVPDVLIYRANTFSTTNFNDVFQKESIFSYSNVWSTSNSAASFTILDQLGVTYMALDKYVYTNTGITAGHTYYQALTCITFTSGLEQQFVEFEQSSFNDLANGVSGVTLSVVVNASDIVDSDGNSYFGQSQLADIAEKATVLSEETAGYYKVLVKESDVSGKYLLSYSTT